MESFVIFIYLLYIQFGISEIYKVINTKEIGKDK